MRKKFETNVASEMPKTKINEPELPWKLRQRDLERIGPSPADDEYRKAASPLRTRAFFLIILVLAIFAVVIYLIFNIMTENENIRAATLKSEKEASAVRAQLEKAVGEKKALAENAAQLEKKINDLSAQKELFTSVIETLTKKSDEIETKKNEEVLPDKKNEQDELNSKK